MWFSARTEAGKKTNQNSKDILYCDSQVMAVKPVHWETGNFGNKVDPTLFG